MLNVIEEIKTRKIIAILRNIPEDKVMLTAQALYDGGVRLIELTFNQSDPEAIKRSAKSIVELAERFQGSFLIGAGTVMDVGQMEIALEAGASYIVSPHADAELIRETVSRGSVSIPGALTPSEIVMAHKAGAHFIKVFPAGDLGVGYMKSIRAPINHIPLLAVGGIDEFNMSEFLKTGVAGVGVGSSMVDMKMIADGKFDELTEKVKRYVRQIGV